MKPIGFGGENFDIINAKKIIGWFSTLLIAGSLVLFVGAFGPVVFANLSYYVTKAFGSGWKLDTSTNSPSSSVQNVKTVIEQKPLSIKPANLESSIVIEKIGVSAPIVINVSVQNQDAYKEALRYGVAHAKGSALPGQTGNTFLFAHSSINFWELGKYATVFNLIGKLEAGDIIVLFYKGERFDYEVIDKRVVQGFNTLPLVRQTTYPILTMQTCDPPGTTLNRLIVTAVIKNSKLK